MFTNVQPRDWLPAASAPTEALARFASQLELANLSTEEMHAAKRHLLDSIGSCVAGLEQPLVISAADLLGKICGSRGNIPVVGSTTRTDLLTAVYLMAISCHALELDDGNREGSIHPGTLVVPAVLGAGHDINCNGSAALCGIVAGYEVAVSLAEVLHPHASRRGFQTTGVVGVLGAAAATGRLLGLDVDTMEKALGIAASSGAGIFGYLTGGGNIKKLHPGHSAREGVFAALLAQHNVVEGARGIAETRAGVFHAFAGIQPWTGEKPGHRDGSLAITRSYLKPYPCCRHIHPAIDGLFELVERYRINPDLVTRLDIGTYHAAMPHATMGWESLTSAQLSFPYVMAAALRTGNVVLDTFGDQSRNDQRILADIAKVHIFEDSECSISYPRQGPARVTVSMTDDTVYTTYVADPRGCPELPMADENLFDKFRMMVTKQHTLSSANRIIEMVWEIEHAASIRPLINLLCSPA